MPVDSFRVWCEHGLYLTGLGFREGVELGLSELSVGTGKPPGEGPEARGHEDNIGLVC
uniref:Uncharacterized protein n=1 Tax=Moniliophthora roreri TaxID=221103 RepID=A0A0W0F2I4_MONRR